MDEQTNAEAPEQKPYKKVVSFSVDSILLKRFNTLVDWKDMNKSKWLERNMRQFLDDHIPNLTKDSEDNVQTENQ